MSKPVPRVDPLDDAASARQNVLRALAVFRRRGWIAVLAGGATVAALLVASLFRAPQYAATGTVQVGMFSSPGLDARSPAAQAMFETNEHLLTSNEVIDATLQRLGWELIEGPGRAEQRAMFLMMFTIKPIQDTFLIQIEGRSADPRFAADAVNALMETFVPFSDEFLGSRDVARERQLRQQEATLIQRLRLAEEQQRALVEQTGVPNFDLERGGPIARQQELQARLMGVQLDLAQAKAERLQLSRRVRQIEGTPEVEQLAGLAVGDALIEARRAAIAELNVRLASLRTHVPPDKLQALPDYNELRAQLESARRGFRELLEGSAREALAMVGQRIAALEAQEETLTRHVQEHTREVVALNQLEGRFRLLRREIDTAERELDQTRSELRKLEGRNAGGTGAAIVDRAEQPVEAKARVGAAALLAAAVFMFGATFVGLLVIDHLDDAVMRVDDLLEVGVPVLGQVPHLDLSEVDELTHLRGSSWAAEALGLIRTNLAVATGGLRKGAVLVTSSQPGEGKSFFSLNLATALARAGGRTLLIEADMRRPRIRPLLVLDERDEGLSNVLLGEARLEDVVRDTEFEGLDVIPSGPCPLNPPDVLLRPELARLLERALELYDHVVIDGPPARPLADASLLARHVQGVVHVARVGASRRSSVRHAIEQIHGVGGRNLGVVLNDVLPEDDPTFRYAGYDERLPARGQAPPGGFFVVLPQVGDDAPDAPAAEAARDLPTPAPTDLPVPGGTFVVLDDILLEGAKQRRNGRPPA